MAISYYAHGSGPVHVLCAHSWVVSSVAFAPMLPHLDAEKMTWVFPDFSGYGFSEAIVGKMSVSEMAGDLVGVADRLGWDSFHLVGHSMGGKAVQAVLGDQAVRSRIRTATLISSVPGWEYRIDGESEELLLKAAGDPATMREVVGHLAGGRCGTGFSRYVAALSQSTSDQAVMREYLRAWTRCDVSAGVGEYRRPVLVLSGESDPMLGPSVSEGMAAQFSEAEHVVLPGVGHFAPLEIPVQLSTQVVRHIIGN